MRFIVAVRAFFRALFDAKIARRIEAVLDEGESAPSTQPRPLAAQEPPKPGRSEAITLLATLQREARLVDFLRESLDDYSDAQIGAAARDIHRDAAAVVERMFAIEAVVDGEEGSAVEGGAVEVPAGFDAGCYRLTGNVTGEPPFRGTVVHHGWRATKCELAAWSGSTAAADIVAPAEVELE